MGYQNVRSSEYKGDVNSDTDIECKCVQTADAGQDRHGTRNDNMQIVFSPGCEQPLRDNHQNVSCYTEPHLEMYSTFCCFTVFSCISCFLPITFTPLEKKKKCNNCNIILFKVVLGGCPSCPDNHDLSKCHCLYDLGRHI